MKRSHNKQTQACSSTVCWREQNMNLIKKIFFLIFLTKRVECFLSESETKLLVYLLRIGVVKNCILSPQIKQDSSIVNLLKILSEEKQVLTVIVKQENLGRYLDDMDSRFLSRVSIVLKEDNLSSKIFFQNKTAIASYSWIVFDSGALKYDLDKIYIPYNCLLFLIEKIHNDHYMVYEVYNIRKFTPKIIKTFAEWKNNSLTSIDEEWSARRNDMFGYNFITVKFSEQLYITPKDKINEEIWNELSVILNFSIVQKVVKYSVESGPLELAPESEEEAFLDTQIYIGVGQNSKSLLGPTSQSKLFMHLKVSGEDKRLTRFLKPFSNTTWMSIALWILVCGFFVLFAEYIFMRLEKIEKRANELHLVVFIPLHSLCNQNGLEVSKTITSRFLLLVIRISGLIFYYAYSATFISYLLLYIPELPFTDLKGFIEDGTYKIEGEGNSEVDTFFRVSPDPLEKLVYEEYFSDVKKWSRFDKGVDRMCAGEKLVLVGYDNDIDKYMPCHIVKIRKPLKIFENGFKIKYKSPYKEIFHIKLSLLRVTGILQRLNNKIIFANIRRFDSEKSYDIKLEKVVSVFVMLGFGYGMSACILAVEILVWKVKNRKKKKSTNSKTLILPFKH